MTVKGIRDRDGNTDGLQAAAVERVVGLVAVNSPDFFEKYFDLVSGGNIVVILRSEDDWERIDACRVSQIVKPVASGGWIARSGTLPSTDQIAQIAFTSGTQGEPKGVILTQANLADTVDRLIDVMGIDSSIREYIGVPVYHSFGLGRCRVGAAVGGMNFVPEGGFDLYEIARMLESGEINAISAVPTLWRIALKNPSVLRPGSEQVKWIEIGSQAMSADEKCAMKALFPNARIVQHYGLTEASRTTFLDLQGKDQEELASVGVPNGDVEVGLTDDGLIRIRGANVATSLLVGGQQVPNTDEAGWFETKDLGELRNGKLYFLGRFDDMINLGGLKVAADHVEAELLHRLGLGGRDLSVVRVSDCERGDGIVVAITSACSANDASILGVVDQVLRENGISAASAVHLMRVDALPLTETGKVKRRELAEQYDAGLKQVTPTSTAGLVVSAFTGLKGEILRTMGFVGSNAGVREIFQDVFPAQIVSDTDTFSSLSGDSLKFVEASLSLETHLGQLPDGWPNMTVGELAKLSRHRTMAKNVDSTIWLRCIGIIGVVAIHFTSFDTGGAALMLLLAAGYNFSRFHAHSYISTGQVGSILRTARRIAFIAVAILLMIQALKWEFQWDMVFLVSNLTGVQDDIPIGQVDPREIWFVAAYVQILLLLALILWLPPVRSLTNRNLTATTFGGFLIFVLVALGVKALRESPDTPMLTDSAPYMVMWLFLAGALIEQGRNLATRVLSVGVAVVAAVMIWDPGPGFREYHPLLWVLFGCLFLTFTNRVMLPYPLNLVVSWIGGASLYIYITHWYIGRAWWKIAPVDSEALTMIVSIAFGVVFWVLVEAAIGQLNWLRTRIGAR